MSFDSDEILDFKRAISLYNSAKTKKMDATDEVSHEMTKTRFRRVLAPVIALFDRKIDELIPEVKVGDIPVAHRELLMKLIRNPMKIQLASSKWKSDMINADDAVVETEDLILDIVPSLLDYRKVQTKKGKTIGQLAKKPAKRKATKKRKSTKTARKLTRELGIRLEHFD